ncbi:hypothetical protein L345_03695, partial [Ophiophagus hannah]
MSRYTSPVNPAVFPHLTVVLLAIGMFFTAWFFVYEVTSTKYTRDIYKELLISLVASLFMGFGVLFLLLWVGIYRALPKCRQHKISEPTTSANQRGGEGWCLGSNLSTYHSPAEGSKLRIRSLGESRKIKGLLKAK